MTWAWSITDRAGITTAFVVPRRATIERRLNGSTNLVLEADADQAEGLVHGHLVRGDRTPAAGGERVLRVHGQVADVQASASTDAIERVTAGVVDGFSLLGARHTIASFDYVATTPLGIVYDQVVTEDGRAVIGLYVDHTGPTAGPPRDRAYDPGKSVQEIVQQLAEVDDGFYFRVDTYDGEKFGKQLFSELVLLYPGSGTDLEISLEYGAGTRGNLSAAEVNVQPPVNYVHLFGAGEVGSQVESFVLDAASIETYGLYEHVETFSDVSEQDTLDQHALDRIRVYPAKTFTVKPFALGENCPRPWDDFDVGDTLLVRIAGASPYLLDSFRARVTAFTVEVTEDSVELLTSISLEAVDA